MNSNDGGNEQLQRKPCQTTRVVVKRRRGGNKQLQQETYNGKKREINDYHNELHKHK